MLLSLLFLMGSASCRCFMLSLMLSDVRFGRNLFPEILLYFRSFQCCCVSVCAGVCVGLCVGVCVGVCARFVVSNNK